MTAAGLRTIRVGTAPSYEVHAGEGALRLAVEWAQQRSKCLVVADANVWALHRHALAQLGAPVACVPSGEATKSLATIERVAERLAEERVDRDGAMSADEGLALTLAFTRIMTGEVTWRLARAPGRRVQPIPAMSVPHVALALHAQLQHCFSHSYLTSTPAVANLACRF